MKANSDKSKQSNKATRRVLAGVLCGASVLSLVLSLVMPPISQAIANDGQATPTEEAVADENTLDEEAGAGNSTGKDAKNQNSDDAEGGEGEDAAVADSAADGAEAESAAQPADDGGDDENSIALADVNTNVDIELQGDVTDRFTTGGSYCLTSDAWSTKPIKIEKDTKINLAGHKLYYRVGNNDTFITVASGALTIEDSAKSSDKTSTDNENNPGRAAAMTWDTNNNGTLTYYVTTSMPSEGGFGTTETTTKHVVSGFGAIVAASDSGSVKQVISVQGGSTLNLTGGMITTPRTLGNSGHVILSQGAVNISGGYVTNGNDGGWGGGLCVTGANAKLNMTNGVIAANKAASGGGIYADQGATLNLSGGVISGNATYGNTINNGDDTNAGGYGGGVYTKGANVTISGSACITNNRVNDRVTDNLYNNGVLGGGGIACTHGGTLTMTDGSVTANYSHEAGGGIYAGFWNQWIKFKMTGGIIAGNMSENAEGGGLRISTGTTGDIGTEPGTSNKIYITNNKTMTGSTNGRGGDWGGGGIFIQQGGKLNIVQTLITNNEAGGWGGGVGACPTGETIVSHSNGAAIYNNADHGEHFSAGGHDKDLDKNTNYITSTFKEEGHKDFFLVRKDDSQNTVAVVLGKMLGGGSAGWKGTCDREKITIDANGGAEAKYMFGLEAHPTNDAKTAAQNAATTVISGNYSYTHGGGIMTNGDLVVDKVEALNVYPAIKVKANKVLKKDGSTQSLSGHGYQFKLLGKAVGSDGEPYWNENGTLNASGCEATPEVTVNDEGEIVTDTAANFQSGNYDLYLVEVPVDEKGTTFDQTIYKIHVSVSANPVTTTLMGIKINRYVVDTGASKVSVKKRGDTGFTPYDFYNWNVDPADSAVSTVTIGNDSNPAFTNELAPYQTSGTWTPQVTKMVDGGEMKKFKFELYTMDASGNEEVLDTQFTSKGTGNEATVTFDNQTIGPLGIKDLTNGKATFTYYIRECDANEDEGTKHEGYTNDAKTFKVVVTAKDDGNGHLTCTPAYYEVDANGNESATPTSTPTFTNTYSTSLPLSGMSGVTLTYLAGAAVLCAAAAWMHIRRKANAKGGKRRE
ncbi:MAG: FctA domain-containing protein [Collinsella sp.]|nr:FctA domain-containing protein [Collinsella sp.]